MLGRDLAVVRDEPGQAIQRGLGEAQGLPHVPDRHPGPVADHVRDHRGMAPPVFLVHVLDHFFAPLVHDVEVDVRRLGALP